MKKFIRWGVFLIGIPVAIFSLLSFDNSSSGYEPILMTRESMENAVQYLDAREIEIPGKLWVYDQYIFVIEEYKGIHILDNSDVHNPKNMAFIQVDGCTDVAVNEGLIYANNAVDLIGIKTNLENRSMEVVSRSRNVLPELISPEGGYARDFQKFRPENTIIVRYEPYN